MMCDTPVPFISATMKVACTHIIDQSRDRYAEAINDDDNDDDDDDDDDGPRFGDGEVCE